MEKNGREKKTLAFASEKAMKNMMRWRRQIKRTRKKTRALLRPKSIVIIMKSLNVLHEMLKMIMLTMIMAVEMTMMAMMKKMMMVTQKLMGRLLFHRHPNPRF